MEMMAAAQSGQLQKLLAEKGITCSEAAIDAYQFLPGWVRPPERIAA